MAVQSSADGMKIPEEIQEQAKSMIREAFRFFGDHNRKMAADMAALRKEDQAAKERIMRGASRNNGRIV